MKYPILAAFSAAAVGFLIGISFPVEITPKIYPWSFFDANSTFGTSSIYGRFSTPLENNSTCTSTVESNGTVEKIVTPAKPKGAERLPPDIIVRESDIHLRRLWGNPQEDTPPRKYLLVLTVGYSEKDCVNAIVQKFSENFDIMLFHYDRQTTEWDEFEWSKKAVHVSARKQAKWWYAKRFMHPSILAPYEYVFLWDQDLGVETFDAEEYLKIVRKHGLEISQPGLDIIRGVKTYDVNVRMEGSEIHRSDGFVEVMAPVFTREAWICVWHMIQNDLVHGWGLDWNFWRCVDEHKEHIGVVDAQYIAHHVGFTLGDHESDTDGSRGNVRDRASVEFGIFKSRVNDAEKAQAVAHPPIPLDARSMC